MTPPDPRNQTSGWLGRNGLALYAALVATAGLAWNVQSFRAQAGHLAAIPLATVVDAVTVDGKTTIKYPFLVVNAGGRPVNLFGMASSALISGFEVKSAQMAFTAQRLDAADSRTLHLEWDLPSAQWPGLPDQQAEVTVTLRTTAGDVPFRATPTVRFPAVKP